MSKFSALKLLIKWLAKKFKGNLFLVEKQSTIDFEKQFLVGKSIYSFHLFLAYTIFIFLRNKKEEN